MKKVLALVLALVLIASLSVTAFAAPKKTVIRIGHSDKTDNAIHISLEHFAEAVKERTNGEVEIQIFAAEQLGPNSEMIEQVFPSCSLTMTMCTESLTVRSVKSFSKAFPTTT